MGGWNKGVIGTKGWMIRMLTMFYILKHRQVDTVLYYKIDV